MPADAVCWLTPKAEGRRTAGLGEGTFARETIAAGEPIARWTGRVVGLAELTQLPRRLRANSIQIDVDAYLVPPRLVSGDHVNHSCEPNAGLHGDRMLVALRDIAAGEEISYDYAMSDSSRYDEFACRCGSPVCRGAVTGEDWKLPDLRERYRDYFSPYLQRLIDEGSHKARAGCTAPQRAGAARR
jgi:hypothetical protein